jgi:hypothetical protein
MEGSYVDSASIQAIAHSIDVHKLSDDAAKALSPDVDYRLREIIQARSEPSQAAFSPDRLRPGLRFSLDRVAGRQEVRPACKAHQGLDRRHQPGPEAEEL